MGFPQRVHSLVGRNWHAWRLLNQLVLSLFQVAEHGQRVRVSGVSAARRPGQPTSATRYVRFFVFNFPFFRHLLRFLARLGDATRAVGSESALSRGVWVEAAQTGGREKGSRSYRHLGDSNKWTEIGIGERNGLCSSAVPSPCRLPCHCSDRKL